MKKLVLVLMVLFALSSCTKNSRAKTFGGEIKIELPKDTKLVTVTWKESQLWYLVRDRRENETIETYTFIEDSSFGMWEGTVILIEK